MLQLRVFGETETLRGVSTWLETSGHGRHVVVVPQVHPVDSGLLMADVARASVDDVVGHLSAVGVGPDDVSFIKVATVGPAPDGIRATSLIWADMMGLARSNARPTARYLVLMVVAGVIAGYGVLTINDTLIIGAMAVSPDSYPIVSACVGIVGRRWRLISRSVATLVVGLAAVGRNGGGRRRHRRRITSVGCVLGDLAEPRRAGDDRRRDCRRCAGRRRRGGAVDRDQSQCRGRCRHFGDHDPGRRVLRGRGRGRPARQGRRCARGARGERRDVAGWWICHARRAALAEPARRARRRPEAEKPSATVDRPPPMSYGFGKPATAEPRVTPTEATRPSCALA